MKTYSLLLVDDNFPILRSLGRIFDKNNFSTDLASTGEEAIQKLAIKSYDVVLCDLILPGISGLDVLIEAKRLYPLASTILLTGDASEETLSKSLDIGISDLLIKPLDEQELLGRLDKCLKRYELRLRTRNIERKLFSDRGGD